MTDGEFVNLLADTNGWMPNAVVPDDAALHKIREARESGTVFFSYDRIS